MNAFQNDVLSAVADDYEDVGTILSDLRKWHPGLTIREEEVVAALGELIRLGLASSFELSTTLPARSVTFDPSRANELYFYITAAGKKVLIL